MKKFRQPAISVLKLEDEDIISTSPGCFDSFACKNCYCTIVTCEGVYDCDGLNCPTLSDYD